MKKLYQGAGAMAHQNHKSQHKYKHVIQTFISKLEGNMSLQRWVLGRETWVIAEGTLKWTVDLELKQ